MFELIKKENYPVLKKFINQYKYKVSVNSILDGNTKGKVFADSQTNPTIAFIFNDNNLVSIFGQIKDIDKFNKDFKKAIDEFIVPVLRLKGEDMGLLISFFNEKYWEPLYDKVIEEKYLLKCSRWIGEFDEDHYSKFKSRFPKTLPEGYKLCKINKEILEADENKALKDQVFESWENIDTYLKKGFGYCILKNLKVVSSAYSGDVSDNLYYEIWIDTYDDNERNKGYSTQCAIAYIDHCLENKYIPHWATDYDNIASQKLATKIGYPSSSNENRFQFRLNRTHNYFINIFYHFNNKEIDHDFITLALKKLFEEKDQKTFAKYVYRVAGKFSEKGLKDKEIFLLEEHLKMLKANNKS
jgi:hypothetical protein